jgi:beta-fructofuranosidase
MNDPNGCFVDANGTWHLYYQYNPTATVAGNQHWGHATSRDLYHWENQPIAIFPPTPTQYVFSGSAVIDKDNTSGFFPDQDNGVIAIYTLATYNPNQGPQTQNIAISHDGGYTFTPWEGNPVIDSTSNQFRDPKVFWYKDHWVLVVAYAVEFTVGIYTSPDLKSWTHASNFTGVGLTGVQWECPNLVEMPIQGTEDTVFVMVVSINPGAPLGGSISQYYPGEFNGTHFIPVDNFARIADFGKDNYAGQFFFGTPHGQDAVSIAWASNWQYSQQVPTGQLEGWRSAMGLPRKNFITKAQRIGWVLGSVPYDLSPLYDAQFVSNDSLGNATIAAVFSPSPSDLPPVSTFLPYIPTDVANML